MKLLIIFIFALSVFAEDISNRIASEYTKKNPTSFEDAAKRGAITATRHHFETIAKDSPLNKEFNDFLKGLEFEIWKVDSKPQEIEKKEDKPVKKSTDKTVKPSVKEPTMKQESPKPITTKSLKVRLRGNKVVIKFSMGNFQSETKITIKGVNIDATQGADKSIRHSASYDKKTVRVNTEKTVLKDTSVGTNMTYGLSSRETINKVYLSYAF